MTKAPQPSDSAPEEAPGLSVLERALAQGEGPPAAMGAFREAQIAAWSDDRQGVLAGGRAAILSASCLLRPEPGDRVLVWSEGDGPNFVLAVLTRAGQDATAVLSSSAPLAIRAPRLAIASGSVQVECEELLTHAQRRHSIEDTATQTSRLRVAQVGVDVRRATTVDDEIAGTFLQRVGTWISNTTRDARLKARTFLFD